MLRLKDERDALTDRWRKATEYSVRYYNKTHVLKNYNVGDRVMLSSKNLKIKAPSDKLNPRFVGPFTVLEGVGL